ncbi:MAG: hypothetical protein HGB17_00510 [Syntrophobacteraceae bacterium]|nr:hypothetical protein [Syntrophobacteraceae bacterium]
MESIVTARATHPGFWKSIQGNLIFLLLLLLITTILIQAHIYLERFQTRRAKELEANLEVARATARSFEIFLRDVVRSELVIGLALTTSPPITDLDRDRILDRFHRDNPAVRSVFWIDPGGWIVASSLRNIIGVNVSDCSYFQQILTGLDWAVSEVFLGRITEKPTFVISRGIRNEEGELSGVVATAIESDRLDSIIRIDRSGDAGASLLDHEGVHVDRHPPTALKWEQRNWLKSYPVIAGALNGKEVTSTVTSEVTGKKRLVGFAPVSSIGWVAAASRAEGDAMRAITSALVPQAFLVLVVTLIAFCGALLLSRFIASPSRQLRDQALQFG